MPFALVARLLFARAPWFPCEALRRAVVYQDVHLLFVWWHYVTDEQHSQQCGDNSAVVEGVNSCWHWKWTSSGRCAGDACRDYESHEEGLEMRIDDSVNDLRVYPLPYAQQRVRG